MLVRLALVAWLCPLVAWASDPPPWIQQPQSDPQPGVEFEPRPGTLYIKMDGLDPTTCAIMPGHSARDCSYFLNEDMPLEPWGSDTERDAFVAELEAMLDDFDVSIRTERPPDYVPYSMVVVTASDLGVDYLACTEGPTNCDGSRRNQIAAVTMGRCPVGDPFVPTMVAFGKLSGLDHTDVLNDLMGTAFPPSTRYFPDNCHTLAANPTCEDIHDYYCGSSGQNSWVEISSVYGARREDSRAPAIEAFEPEHCTRLGLGEHQEIRATLSDDSNALAVRLTLESAQEGIDICTNSMCALDVDDRFVVGDPVELAVLHGTYDAAIEMRLEVQDMYGNGIDRTQVVLLGNGTHPLCGGEGETSTTSPPGMTTLPPEPPPTGTSTSGSPDMPPGVDSSNTRGCSCRSVSPSLQLSLLALLAVVAARTRSR